MSFKILIVDDFEPFRRMIRLALQQGSEFDVIGEASDGLEAIHKAQELQPHLILLDIGLPKLNGIQAGRRIRKISPESKILFLSLESSRDVVQEALELGALGYVVKSDAAGELLSAMDAVLQGKQFVSSSLKPFINTADVEQATTWKVSGRYFEACKCEAICPCREQGGMRVGLCDFLLSWRIAKGAFANVDLSDRFVVMAGSYRADEPDKPWRVILYLDERSSDEQFAALSDIFLGRAGGTIFENFAAKIGEIDAVRRAAIELDHSPGRWFRRASSWVEVRATRNMSSELLPVHDGLPGHDRSGNQLAAGVLCVHDEPLDFQLREQCGFETDFEYSSLNAA